MTTMIPTLWPEGIKVDVLPPLTILRYQAAKIRELTKGILEGEVTTVTGPDDFVSHRLDLIAPTLDGRRFRVLTATHRADFYPVVLEADCFRPQRSAFLGASLPSIGQIATAAMSPWPHKGDWRPVVNNQDEFLGRVGEVLRSGEVRSVIDSMIALSNEKSLGVATEQAENDPQMNGSEMQ